MIHSNCSDASLEERTQVLTILSMNTSLILEHVLTLMRTNNQLMKENIILQSKCKQADTKYDQHIPASIDNSTTTTIVDNSTKTTICHVHDNSTTNITVNLFRNENIEYIHIPDYLTDKYGIVKLVKDIHFHRDHPENHNIKLDRDKALIYKTRFRDKKPVWEEFPTDVALSELIQNGEDLLCNYSEKNQLPDVKKNVLDVVTDIVYRETNWNCLTEKLFKSLKRLFKNLTVNLDGEDGVQQGVCIPVYLDEHIVSRIEPSEYEVATPFPVPPVPRAFVHSLTNLEHLLVSPCLLPFYSLSFLSP